MTMMIIDVIYKPDIKSTSAGKGNEKHRRVIGRPRALPSKRPLRKLEWLAPNPDDFM